MRDRKPLFLEKQNKNHPTQQRGFRERGLGGEFNGPNGPGGPDGLIDFG